MPVRRAMALRLLCQTQPALGHVDQPQFDGRNGDLIRKRQTLGGIPLILAPRHNATPPADAPQRFASAPSSRWFRTCGEMLFASGQPLCCVGFCTFVAYASPQSRARNWRRGGAGLVARPRSQARRSESVAAHRGGAQHVLGARYYRPEAKRRFSPHHGWCARRRRHNTVRHLDPAQRRRFSQCGEFEVPISWRLALVGPSNS